jgi:predicted Zn-dependent protease
MLLKHLLPGVACLALLSGCASDAPQATAKTPTTVGAAVAEADTAIATGQRAKGLALLKAATVAYPKDKAPWLRMAQNSFDHQDYGNAIVSGLEVLARDGDDQQAHSILAVAGLRVSLKALADLTQKNNLNGTTRSEATELAKLLRARLGEKNIIPEIKPAGNKSPRADKPNNTASTSAPKPATKASDDPFQGF